MFSFGKKFKLFTLGGIPIQITSAVFVFGAFIVFSFYAQFSQQFPGSQNRTYVLVAIATALFFGSILIHELAHAGVARALKLDVKDVTLVLFGGYTSVDASQGGPVAEFLVSVAGPTSSVLMGLGLIALGDRTQVANPTAWTIGWMGGLILFFAIINFLPGLPLDGGRMLLALIWSVTKERIRATEIAGMVGQVLGVTLLGLAGLYALGYGAAFDDVFYRLFQLPFQTILVALIGFMMLSSAKAFTQAAKRELSLAGATARDAMAPPPVSIPSNISLTESLDRYLRGHEHETFPVMDEFSRLIGALNYEAARLVGQTEPTRPVRDAMIPLSDLKVVQAETPLADVIAQVGGAAALVVDGAALVGTISAHSINRWADSRQPGRPASASPASPVTPSSAPPPMPPPPPAPPV